MTSTVLYTYPRITLEFHVSRLFGVVRCGPVSCKGQVFPPQLHFLLSLQSHVGFDVSWSKSIVIGSPVLKVSVPLRIVEFENGDQSFSGDLQRTLGINSYHGISIIDLKIFFPPHQVAFTSVITSGSISISSEGEHRKALINRVV